MTFINIHVNVNLIHNLVRAYIDSVKRLPDACNTLQVWQQSKDAKLALWQASEMIRLAKSHTIFSPQNTFSKTASTNLGSSNITEAPHVSICIYVAVLVLWTEAIGQETLDIELVQSVLESGIHILSRLNVRMARMLSNVLRHLAASTTFVS